MPRAAISITILLTCFSIQPALEACGDKLLLAGWTPRFSRVYAAVRPGSVLIYAPAAASGPARDLRDKRLHKGLKAAGHEVTVASTLAELSTALGSGHIDVILSARTLESTLEGQARGGSSKPSVILLDDRTEPEKSGATAAVPATDSVRKGASFYTAIEDAMKKRADAGLYRPRR